MQGGDKKWQLLEHRCNMTSPTDTSWAFYPTEDSRIDGLWMIFAHVTKYRPPWTPSTKQSKPLKVGNTMNQLPLKAKSNEPNKQQNRKSQMTLNKKTCKRCIEVWNMKNQMTSKTETSKTVDFYLNTYVDVTTQNNEIEKKRRSPWVDPNRWKPGPLWRSTLSRQSIPAAPKGGLMVLMYSKASKRDPPLGRCWLFNIIYKFWCSLKSLA